MYYWATLYWAYPLSKWMSIRFTWGKTLTAITIRIIPPICTSCLILLKKPYCQKFWKAFLHWCKWEILYEKECRQIFHVSVYWLSYEPSWRRWPGVRYKYGSKDVFTDLMTASIKFTLYQMAARPFKKPISAYRYTQGILNVCRKFFKHENNFILIFEFLLLPIESFMKQSSTGGGLPFPPWILWPRWSWIFWETIWSLCLWSSSRRHLRQNRL